MIRMLLDQLADPYELWSWRPCTKSLTSQFEGFFKNLVHYPISHVGAQLYSTTGHDSLPGQAWTG